MQQKRQPLDLSSLSLADFAPRRPAEMPQTPSLKQVETATTYPSREASVEDQLNIKGSKQVLDRFRELRKTERYKYADLLEFMMDAYEGKRE